MKLYKPIKQMLQLSSFFFGTCYIDIMSMGLVTKFVVNTFQRDKGDAVSAI